MSIPEPNTGVLFSCISCLITTSSSEEKKSIPPALRRTLWPDWRAADEADSKWSTRLAKQANSFPTLTTLKLAEAQSHHLQQIQISKYKWPAQLHTHNLTAQGNISHAPSSPRAVSTVCVRWEHLVCGSYLNSTGLQDWAAKQQQHRTEYVHSRNTVTRTQMELLNFLSLQNNQ